MERTEGRLADREEKGSVALRGMALKARSSLLMGTVSPDGGLSNRFLLSLEFLRQLDSDSERQRGLLGDVEVEGRPRLRGLDWEEGSRLRVLDRKGGPTLRGVDQEGSGDPH